MPIINYNSCDWWEKSKGQQTMDIVTNPTCKNHSRIFSNLIWRKIKNYDAHLDLYNF